MLFKTCRIRWNIKLIRQKQNKTEQTLKILIKYRLCYHITTLGPRKFLANQSVKMLLLSVDKEEAWWNSDEMSRLLIQDWWVFWTNLINKVPRVPFKCSSSQEPKCLECPSVSSARLLFEWPRALWVTNFPLSALRIKKVCNITSNGLVDRSIEPLKAHYRMHIFRICILHNTNCRLLPWK